MYIINNHPHQRIKGPYMSRTMIMICVFRTILMSNTHQPQKNGNKSDSIVMPTAWQHPTLKNKKWLNPDKGKSLLEIPKLLLVKSRNISTNSHCGWREPRGPTNTWSYSHGSAHVIVRWCSRSFLLLIKVESPYNPHIGERSFLGCIHIWPKYENESELGSFSLFSHIW